MPSAIAQLMLRSDMVSTLELASQLQSGRHGYLMTDVNIIALGDTRNSTSFNEKSWDDGSFMEDGKSGLSSKITWLFEEFIDSFFDV
jgi:hypothetical protein